MRRAFIASELRPLRCSWTIPEQKTIIFIYRSGTSEMEPSKILLLEIVPWTEPSLLSPKPVLSVKTLVSKKLRVSSGPHPEEAPFRGWPPGEPRTRKK